MPAHQDQHIVVHQGENPHGPAQPAAAQTNSTDSQGDAGCDEEEEVILVDDEEEEEEVDEEDDYEEDESPRRL